VHHWPLWARPEQLLPQGDWDTWLILSGRGWGKTRTGAEAVREWARNPGWRIALVGRTAADVRDVIVEGESGILACCPTWERPLYEPSKRRLTWPNGAQATTYSADEPDLLRGPQHHAALCDELATWAYLDEAWSNLVLGLRLGAQPRKVITTTPRPLALIRQLLADTRCQVTRGSTFDNAQNLAASALREFRAKYEGTRLGRQELNGEVLDDVPGALWARPQLDGSRVHVAPELARIVVAIDPAVTASAESDETGIVVAGKGVDGALYVLADRSCRLSPDGWARRAIVALDEFAADRIVAEVNNGGDLVENVLRTVRPEAPYRAVRASRGKRVRAEPIAALYEQGRVHHVGLHAQLEDQMCSFLPEGNERSPDRVDALVWALTDLTESMPGSGIFEWMRSEAEAVRTRP
jgi:phage terminase large subunit-like protein